AERLSAGRSKEGSAPAGKSYRYDEWDCEGEDYRPGWCRVVETAVPPGEAESVEEFLNEYRGMIRSIQTAFQYLRPEGLKRIKGEREGDELDLDALLASRVEARSGRAPSDRVYIQRLKRERSVAVAFLVDMSGSTQRGLAGGKSILRVEQEALAILSHAVEAAGDSFALYGFSGEGKETVRFYLLKDFHEKSGAEIDRRIGRIRPEAQNRDGAAIRHAARKLAARPAKIKLLVLISDGKPLDDGYTGAYAAADTRTALQEAKRLGIHPYCVTVDREGDEYLRGMYGEVAYLVIDRVEALPAKLPQIYKRLTT
ncbi:MAG TPA: VWA domain-containing protein, partial [Candidatus Manganitrophaceae bacterium]